MDNLSVMDHYLQIGMGIGGAERPMLEGYTTLGFLAAHTSTVELQLLVTGVTYRHPGLLAKIVSTLDVLSGGRAVLGIGAAWYEREHAALGVPFPPLGNGSSGSRRRCRSCTRCGATTTARIDGKHYRLAETINSPQPLRRPHPPIMIGGAGEKKTLRLVAHYADACNLFAGRRAEPRRSGEARRPAPSTARGRAPTSTGSARRSCGPDRWSHRRRRQGLRRAVGPYADVGVDEVHVMPFTGDPVAFVNGLGEHIVGPLEDAL